MLCAAAVKVNFPVANFGVGLALLLTLALAGCQLLTEPLAGREPRPLLQRGPSPDHLIYRSANEAAVATAGSAAVVDTEGYYHDIAVFTAGQDSDRQTVQLSVRLDMSGHWYLYDCRPRPTVAAATESGPRPGGPFTRAAFPEIERLPPPDYAGPDLPELAAGLPDDEIWLAADAGLRRMLDALVAGDAAGASRCAGPVAYRDAYYELFSPAALAELNGYAVCGYGVSEEGMMLVRVELQRSAGGADYRQPLWCKIVVTGGGPLVMGMDFGRPRPRAAGAGA